MPCGFGSKGERVKLSQIFQNLINNSVKFIDKPEGLIKIGLQGHKELNDNYLTIYIEDNGPGIPKEYHDKVFGLFQRLQKDSEGTGIGLSIVHKIMKTHGGKVWIESGHPGEGCTFWMEFPGVVPT